MECIHGITQNFNFDCDFLPVRGIEQRVLLFNFEDIDRAKTRFNPEKTVIENLELEFYHEGRSGYTPAGFWVFGAKHHFDGGQKASKNKNEKGFTHEINLIAYTMNAHNFNQLNRLLHGTFVAVVETKFKGATQKNAFEILGYDAGLTLKDITRRYNQRGAVATFTLATPSEVKELRMPYKWLEGDYPSTEEKINNITNSKYKIFDFSFDYTFE